MVCAIALPAGAVKPQCDDALPGHTPDHPICSNDDPVDPPPDEPLAGTTCKALGEWDEPVWLDDYHFTITLTENACIDVMANAGVWTVEIDENPDDENPDDENPDGTLRWLSLVIRDSVAPGDACDSVAYRTDIPSEITLDGFESDNNPGIAGAWVNSCGTDWAEWVGDVYHAAENKSVPSPLVLQVFMSGKDAKVKLTIDLP